MEIEITHAETMVIALKGRLDTLTSAEFNAAIAKEDIQEDVVVIEAKELEYISSAGLRALLALKKNLSGEKKELEIHNVSPVVKEVFRVTGFGNILTVK